RESKAGKASAVHDNTIIPVPTENLTTQEKDATSDTSTQEGSASSVTPLVLSDDLQRIHDKLSVSSLLFYNKLSNEDKLVYLTSVQDISQDTLQEGTRRYRKLGSDIIKLMANIAVTGVTIAGISIVSGAFSSLAGALITTGKIEPTSAITLIGPGIVFSDWIAKFAIA
ncbi:12142_t:CDS:2, partial [Funneliformis geosporum]